MIALLRLVLKEICLLVLVLALLAQKTPGAATGQGWKVFRHGTAQARRHGTARHVPCRAAPGLKIIIRHAGTCLRAGRNYVQSRHAGTAKIF